MVICLVMIHQNGANNRFLEKIRQQIGFIFQSCHLLSSLNALQNVQMSLVLKDIPSMAIANQRSAAILESVGLGDFLQKYPAQLSGGQWRSPVPSSINPK